jgi:hypothetical protein
MVWFWFGLISENETNKYNCNPIAQFFNWRVKRTGGLKKKREDKSRYDCFYLRVSFLINTIYSPFLGGGGIVAFGTLAFCSSFGLGTGSWAALSAAPGAA